MCSVCNCIYNTVIHIETSELRPLMHSMYSLNSKWSANTGHPVYSVTQTDRDRVSKEGLLLDVAA